MCWCSYQTLTLPEDEAANCIYVNNHLIHRCVKHLIFIPFSSLITSFDQLSWMEMKRMEKYMIWSITPPQPFHRDSSLSEAAAGENRVFHQRDFGVGIPEDRPGPLFALHPGEEEQDHQKDITIHPSNFVDLVHGNLKGRYKTTPQSLLKIIISYILSFT